MYMPVLKYAESTFAFEYKEVKQGKGGDLMNTSFSSLTADLVTQLILPHICSFPRNLEHLSIQKINHLTQV